MSMSKLLKILSLGLVIGTFTVPVIAQESQPSTSNTSAQKGNTGPQAKPATQIELNQLAAAGAITACESNMRNKIAIKDALPASALGVAWVIDNFHGGLVEGNSSKISIQQLVSGSYVQILGVIKGICYEKFSASDKKYVDEAIASISEQMKSQQKTTK